LQKRIRTQLQAAADQSACSRTAKTCRNLLALWPALWHFLDDPAVPPTNNAAERALRGFVIRRKLSYFTRSGRGLRFIEHTFSTVQTCRLQGRNVFDYMTQALSAWLAGTSPPSLVPEPIRTQHAAA
jgi:transposase